MAINQVAIAMPDRDSFVKKLAEMQAKGVKFNMRVNHGVPHSVLSRWQCASTSPGSTS